MTELHVDGVDIDLNNRLERPPQRYIRGIGERRLDQLRVDR